MSTLKDFIQKLFKSTSPIEQYVASKNPTNIAEAEHWAREFERKCQEENKVF